MITAEDVYNGIRIRLIIGNNTRTFRIEYPQGWDVKVSQTGSFTVIKCEDPKMEWQTLTPEHDRFEVVEVLPPR